MIFDRDLLDERARVTPAKLALVSIETGERLTYGDLDVRAQSFAAALGSMGIAAGDRFGILAHNSVDFVALFFAAGKIDAIVVPLSTRATAHELEVILRDCGMKLLVYGDEFAETARALPVASSRIHDLPTSDHQPLISRRHDPEATYCLLYTSGTTGKPKGVMIPRRQLYWNGYNTAVDWDLRADDISPIYTPLYHAGGVAAFLIPIFCAGGTIVVHRSFDVSAVWKSIQEDRCTVVLGVPTIWKMLMDAPEFATANLDQVRWFISGGAPLPQFIIDSYQKRGVVFKQGYGMTEVGVNCFTMTVEDSYNKPGSIGRPMMFTAVKVVDGDGTPVRTGEVGEMWIRGPHVSKGYWNNEDSTRAAYGEDGWFRTGDLARCDEDGFFYIAGRRKDMFISGGVNVYPAEIEAELVAHPLVVDAAVVPIADEKWGEVGVAFVVGRISADELTSYLTERIAKYKVPRRFVFVESLPRTPYGKVMKEQLKLLLGHEE
jgi:fatty-acyl-CoA synthase